ncbi:MAG: PAS domain S-box protein [Deltaproteobacteria bacterium]|nr:PAS domain S-box protein [Deltaproteobacteria bacterium]
MGRPLAILIPEPYLEAYSEELARLRAAADSTLAGRTLELDGRRKDGSQFPLELSLSSWETAKGRFFSAVSRDISSRRQAEAELQQLRHHQELLLNSAWEGILGLDAGENITFVNRAAGRLLGYEPAELIGRHGHSICHHSRTDGSPYPPEECRIYAAIQQGAAICCADEVFWRQDGTCFPVEYSVAPILHDEISGGVVTFWDISRRQEAEALSRSLIETSPIGIYLLQNGKFVLTNHWFHTITGYNDAELARLDFWNLVHPDDRFAVRASAVMMLKGASFSPYEYRNLTKGGKTRWIMETVTSVTYRGKRATLGYFMDITERKQLEDTLLHAQKMEAVGRLAGGVAHDFNNMLTAIMGYVEMLQGSLPQDDPLSYAVEGINKAAERAAALTRQLLAFSRKQLLQPQIVNLNAVVQDTEAMLRRLIGEDIALVKVLDPALGNIRADRGQIEQVIMNLAINARDAMPQGGKLTFQTAHITFAEPHGCQFEIAPPGQYIMLAVSDTGVGMDVELQDHLFEPFFTTKEVGKGTGLGLSTVYGIVKQSEGCIEVQSRPGVGTIFKIYLPWVKEALTPEITAPPTKLEGSETILVVEDEDLVRQLITDVLERYGYRVLSAGNPGEALLLSERHRGPIPLMLTDVVMPQMSGRCLAESLAPRHPEMQVLYMSGYTEDIIGHRGVLENGRLFIQKPFTPAALAQKVRQALEG